MITLYPTDTVYGLGVDATDAAAVDALFALKAREARNPVSIVVADIAMAEAYAELTPLARHLIDSFLPGKLTIVLNTKSNLAPAITAGTGTVGIRIPRHPVPLRIVSELGRPLTATSANLSGLPTLRTPPEILQQFGHLASAVTTVIDEGELPVSLPSTVVDARGDSLIILREGAIPRSEFDSFNH